MAERTRGIFLTSGEEHVWPKNLETRISPEGFGPKNMEKFAENVKKSLRKVHIFARVQIQVPHVFAQKSIPQDYFPACILGRNVGPWKQNISPPPQPIHPPGACASPTPTPRMTPPPPIPCIFNKRLSPRPPDRTPAPFPLPRTEKILKISETSALVQGWALAHVIGKSSGTATPANNTNICTRFQRSEHSYSKDPILHCKVGS